MIQMKKRQLSFLSLHAVLLDPKHQEISWWNASIVPSRQYHPHGGGLCGSGQARSANPQEAIEGWNPHRTDPPALAKGNASPMFSAHGWMLLGKWTTFTLEYQLLWGYFPVLLILFTSSAHMVFLLCSLWIGRRRLMREGEWGETFFSNNCIFWASEPEASMLLELNQVMKIAINTVVLYLCS